MQFRRPRFDSWVRKISWRRKWQPTAVFWPGESHGQRSLAGYSPWGHKESDTTEGLTLSHTSGCRIEAGTGHPKPRRLLLTVLYADPIPFLNSSCFFQAHLSGWGNDGCARLTPSNPTAPTSATGHVQNETPLSADLPMSLSFPRAPPGTLLLRGCSLSRVRPVSSPGPGDGTQQTFLELPSPTLSAAASTRLTPPPQRRTDLGPICPVPMAFLQGLSALSVC